MGRFTSAELRKFRDQPLLGLCSLLRLPTLLAIPILNTLAEQKAKHNLGTEGANADFAAHDVEDWKQPQKKSEGDGWAKPVNPEAAKNVYGGRGKSQRD